MAHDLVETVLSTAHERLAALAEYQVLDTPPEQAFDDIVELAANLCAAPTALVSFVTDERQWFKARVGFSSCETDLRSSVCRFALSEPDLLVIPDLSNDVRTRDNPLVTGEAGLRFYAGAPLRTSEGVVLGTLCVTDTQPRPGGLSGEAREDLRRLARQVMGQLELRRAVIEREAALRRSRDAVEALAQSEARWRGLFEKLREGFIVGQAVRDAEGRIRDWRYIEVNRAWGELLGIDETTVVGRTISEVLPGVEAEWIALAEVVDTGQTITFTAQVGQLDRWYEGRASALGPDLFSVLFLEVTERIRQARALEDSAERKAALVELGDRLRDAKSADEISRAAAAIMGRTLKATRAGYGTVDAARERVDVLADWGGPQVASVAGEHSFRTYGSYIDDLKEGRLVVIPDVARDPRTAANREALSQLGILSLVNSPMLEHGALVSISFVHFDEPREISEEEEAFIRTVADRTQVSIARLRAEERQAVLNAEISHRLKNSLSMVQAVASQTLRASADPEALEAFNQRLRALSRAQDGLMQSQWRATDLADLVRGALELAGAEDRYEARGPAIRLGPHATLSTALILHELTTNACKYGALSTSGGLVTLDWRIDGEGADAELVVTWRERGGPPATPPSRRGFGSSLLRLGLVGAGGSALDYGPDGLSAVFRASLRQVEEA